MQKDFKACEIFLHLGLPWIVARSSTSVIVVKPQLVPRPTLREE